MQHQIITINKKIMEILYFPRKFKACLNNILPMILVRFIMRFSTFIIIFLAMLAPNKAWSAENELIWYHVDSAPGIVSSGPFKGQGYHQYFLKKIQNSMPGYKHTNNSANYSRIIKQLKHSNGCCIAMYKNKEREKFIEFSQPTIIGLSNGIHIIAKDIAKFKPYMDEEGRISIRDLFNNSDLRMGIAKGRRYTGAVDQLIKENQNSDKIYVYYKSDVFRGLIRLLETERTIDYAVGHPQEIRWLTKHRIVKDKFYFIPIKELPPYGLAYVGCTKNEWGKKVINKIDTILGGNYDPEYARMYQEYQPPEGVKLHKKYLPEVFPVRD